MAAQRALMTPAGFSEETGLEPKSIVYCLAEAGLQPEDIHIVINTHLHDDHCGNNSMFGGAQFYAHCDEIALCRNPHPLEQGTQYLYCPITDA
ncbi:MAG: MBL fold metallo-hydrolase [Desulfofustis sp.]|nr:MBL fold metallo-hydrolase [Desulfofustis sp.]